MTKLSSTPPNGANVPNEALPALESLALTLDSLQRTSFVELGQTLVGLGRWSEAALVFGMLVRAHPRDAFAHRALGIALARLGRIRDALISLDAALQLAPRDAFALAQRAFLRMQSDDRNAALADARAAHAAFAGSSAPVARRVRVLLRTLQHD